MTNSERALREIWLKVGGPPMQGAVPCDVERRVLNRIDDLEDELDTARAIFGGMVELVWGSRGALVDGSELVEAFKKISEEVVKLRVSVHIGKAEQGSLQRDADAAMADICCWQKRVAARESRISELVGEVDKLKQKLRVEDTLRATIKEMAADAADLRSTVRAQGDNLYRLRGSTEPELSAHEIEALKRVIRRAETAKS